MKNQDERNAIVRRKLAGRFFVMADLAPEVPLNIMFAATAQVIRFPVSNLRTWAQLGNNLAGPQLKLIEVIPDGNGGYITPDIVKWIDYINSDSEKNFKKAKRKWRAKNPTELPALPLSPVVTGELLLRVLDRLEDEWREKAYALLAYGETP